MKAKSKEVQVFVKRAKKIMDDIAKKRDELRDLVCECNEIIDDADGALLDFESGLDMLSQLL